MFALFLALIISVICGHLSYHDNDRVLFSMALIIGLLSATGMVITAYSHAVAQLPI